MKVVDTIDGSGIYAIRNLKTGRVYIGSTKSLHRRRGEHIQALKNGTHHAARLQASWNKHGADAFEWVVLEIVEVSRLFEREQHWIDENQAAKLKFGYNCSPTAGSPKGLERSEATRSLMGAAKIGRKLSLAHRMKASASRKASGNGRRAAILMWERRSSEERAEISRKISETKKAKRSHWTPEMVAENERQIHERERDQASAKRMKEKEAKAASFGLTTDEYDAVINKARGDAVRLFAARRNEARSPEQVIADEERRRLARRESWLRRNAKRRLTVTKTLSQT